MKAQREEGEMEVSGKRVAVAMVMVPHQGGKVVEERMGCQGRDLPHVGMEAVGRREKEQAQESIRRMMQRLVQRMRFWMTNR